MDSNPTDLKAIELELKAAMRGIREVRHKRRTGSSLPADEPPLCSFCGAGRNNARRLLPGNGVEGLEAYICDECIELAVGLCQPSLDGGNQP